MRRCVNSLIVLTCVLPSVSPAQGPDGNLEFGPIGDNGTVPADAELLPRRGMSEAKPDAPPAKFQADAPLAPVQAAVDAAPTDRVLIDAAKYFDAHAEIDGRTVTLLDVLSAKAFVGPQHIESVRAYWSLRLAMADHAFALDEQRQIEESFAARDEDDASLSAVAARVADTRLAVIDAQYRLDEAIGWKSGGELALASDLPVVGPYRTFFETIFANQSDESTPRRRARRIDATLGPRAEAIAARVRAMDDADRRLGEACQQYAGETATAEDVFAAWRELASHRQVFLSAVREHNFAIAEYAALVVPENSEPARLLPMLIKTQPPAAPTSNQAATPRPVWHPQGVAATPPPQIEQIEQGGVIRASAEEPIAQTPQDSGSRQMRSVLVRSVDVQ